MNKIVWLIGGSNGTESGSNSVSLFDPTTNTTTLGHALKIGRMNHSAVAIDDAVIVCGGHAMFEQNLSIITSCESFTQTAKTWNSMTPLPTPLSNFAMVSLNKQIYIFGGTFNNENGTNNVYTFENNTWHGREKMSVTLFNHAAITHTDHYRALVCGGQKKSGKYGKCFLDCYIYDTHMNTWSKAQYPMAIPRCGHSMVRYHGMDCSFNELLNFHKFASFGISERHIRAFSEKLQSYFKRR